MIPFIEIYVLSRLQTTSTILGKSKISDIDINFGLAFTAHTKTALAGIVVFGAKTMCDGVSIKAKTFNGHRLIGLGVEGSVFRQPRVYNHVHKL